MLSISSWPQLIGRTKFPKIQYKRSGGGVGWGVGWGGGGWGDGIKKAFLNLMQNVNMTLKMATKVTLTRSNTQ